MFDSGCERGDRSKASLVQCEDSVGSKTIGEDDTDGVRQVEVKPLVLASNVLASNLLCRSQIDMLQFGKSIAAVEHAAHESIDYLHRGREAEISMHEVIQLGQYER